MVVHARTFDTNTRYKVAEAESFVALLQDDVACDVQYLVRFVAW